MLSPYSILPTAYLLFLLLLPHPSFSQSTKPLSEYVNPFLGTAAHGHTFPGATRPFGMVQLSPDTRTEGWDACGGYHYSDSTILGFTHTHLSGTGIGDYGDILLMPSTGTIPTARSTTGLASQFRHESENASAGFYSVFLDEPRIRVDLTATRRTGFHRYVFPKTDSAFVLLDLLHGIGPDRVMESAIDFTSDSEITGFRRSKGWAEDQLIYFVIRFSKPFRSHAISMANVLKWGSKSERGTSLSAVVTFQTEEKEEILVKVALSSVDVEGARKNLEAENSDWNFERVKKEASDEWNKALGKIEISGGTNAQKIVFYTALYHTMIAPNIFSDVDGRYRGTDKKIHIAKGYDRYTVFSLWDTFRAAHPLYTILEPERTVDFIRSFLSQYNEGGLLPVWELASNETWTMIGYHAVSAIADAYSKGIRGFDVNKAFTAMKKSARQEHFGLKSYRTYGFVRGERESESVSRTLEYAYDDWCIAEMAKALNQKKDEIEFRTRAQNYQNVFDPSVGFMRARKNGDWIEPFSPYAVTNDYTEANAWQYSFFVPHDVSGLIKLMGGRERFVERLDGLFGASTGLEGRQQSDITGLIGQYAHGNEPSHHMAYLYAHAGAPWKTEELTRRIMDELYSEKPDGLSGNEDCGQMSAWYVLSALGFYQVNPGQPVYVLGSPLFERATVHLGNGGEFTITSNSSQQNKYVQSAKLNGRPYGKSFIMHDDILSGAELAFEMGPEPNRSRATRPEDCPSSPEAAPFVPVPVIAADRPSFADSLEIRIQSLAENADIYFTTDGKQPTAKSKPYRGPFLIGSTCKVRAIAVKDGRTSLTEEAEFRKFRPIGTVTTISEYSPQYTGGGKAALIDGIKGSEDFRIGGWQGYEENDLRIVVDLGETRQLREISISFLQDNNAWIFFPQEIRYSVSMDGITFDPFFQGTTRVAPEQTGAIKKSVPGLGKALARYVMVFAKNIGRCPSWHKGAGGKAWLFADEVEVKP